MITGDQALPQPAEEFTPPHLREDTPELPEAVLRREAFLRSCRWVFAVALLFAMFALARSLLRTTWWIPPRTRHLSIFLLYAPLVIQVVRMLGLGGFIYALGRPLRLTRPILVIGTVLLGLGAAFTSFWVWYSAVGAGYRIVPESHYWMLGVLIFFGVMDFLAVAVVCWLAHSGPGRILYSRGGLAYFSTEGAPRRRETPWLGVAWLVVAFVRWQVVFQVSQALARARGLAP
jgi:hypothetical protein